MRLVSAADCGVDHYVDLGLERAGGIGLNVAVHARRLLGPDDRVTVLAPLGDDPAAAIVLDAVTAHGLDSCLQRRHGATPVQHIRGRPDGERIFVRYDEGVLRGYRAGARERELIGASDVLACAAFGQGLDLFEAVLACPSRGLRAVDFTNANDLGDALAFVEAWAASFDVGFFGLAEGDGLIEALASLAARVPALFVVTLGAGGAVALGPETRSRQPAVPVAKVVDTTGAGDTFTAAFLVEYARRRDLARALERGAEEAAQTVQHLGAFEIA